MLVMEWTFIIPAFFVIALIYASAGFGGGSSYIALLAVVGLSFTLVRSSALLCNIMVVSGSLMLLYRNQNLNLRQVFPLVVLSVPMAFVGGLVPIEKKTFLVLLGSLLVISSLLIWFRHRQHSLTKKDYPLWLMVIIGGVIGFVSGLVGIGGGIFLAPVLYMMKWAKSKDIAGATAFFIVTNSIAGLAGQLTAGTFTWEPMVLFLLLAVLAGGQLGVRITVYRISNFVLSRIVAVVIFTAGVRVLYSQLQL